MNDYVTNQSKQFEGKVIIVTGSTQGSGAETAKLFAARGAKAITICGRQENKGMQIKKDARRAVRWHPSSGIPPSELSARFGSLSSPLL